MPQASTAEFHSKLVDLVLEYVDRCTPIELVGTLEMTKENVIACHVAGNGGCPAKGRHMYYTDDEDDDGESWKHG